MPPIISTGIVTVFNAVTWNMGSTTSITGEFGPRDWRVTGALDSSEVTSEVWLTSTPFGRDVVPEV
ncbi:hypothetical protein LP422_22895 [Janibacter limosus]|nr:hypothetical protein LP422_22895 [Janibacter limosus]